MRATAGVNGLLRGPIDNATGFIRPSPVPQSSAIAPMAWSSRSQGTHGSPSRPQPVSSNRRFSTVSNSHISSGQVAQSLVIGRSALLGTPASFRSVYATAGSALQQHYGQNYPNVPLSPGLSSSSSNSSISTLSTTTMINPDIPNHAGNSAFRSTPRVSGTVIACTLPSVPSISTPVSISQGVTQSPTPPSSISGSTSQEPMPALPPLGCYKLTVTNMSLHATKELVGALIEQKTRRYVTLLQPDPIRLRRFNRQLHAYINFTQRDDAEKAEREIRGFSFMGRQLHAILEHVDGH